MDEGDGLAYEVFALDALVARLALDGCAPDDLLMLAATELRAEKEQQLRDLERARDG